MTQSNPADRVFAEDPEALLLQHEEAELLARLREITGEDLTPALLSRTPPTDWSEEAASLLARYWKVSNELSCLNSRRMSQQLTRFLQASKGEGEMTDAMRRWWMNRY